MQEMLVIFLVLSAVAAGTSGHPFHPDPVMLHYRFPVYPLVRDVLFFRSDPVADVADAYPAVIWVQAPTNGAFGGSLPPLVITPVQQFNPASVPLKETQ